jgi:hypothetical protein
MQFTTPKERRRPRVDRREAAKILGCSRDNVRRLDRIRVLKTGEADRNGTITYDRREIEGLAKERGVGGGPSGELAARVFRMFKERRAFQDIVIETEQEPAVIRALRKEYDAGFSTEHGAETEERAQREHEAQMRMLDAELSARRGQRQ